ncbi:UNVERIFIED_CONTAM: hypothetical protein H355_002035 [Colinus virginianus]|nr:hypothetical protein H355_002035 [Colinus virginianus]
MSSCACVQIGIESGDAHTSTNGNTPANSQQHLVSINTTVTLSKQHATTIVALQMALNVFNGKLPPYSACHFFELYQEKNGQVSASCTASIYFLSLRYVLLLQTNQTGYTTFIILEKIID